MNLQTNPDTTTLAAMFTAASIGETVTYARMSEAVGADIRSRFWLAQAALKIANAEAGALFTTVRSVGYLRIPAQDAAKVGITARGRVRRIARRASVSMTNAVQHANDMPPENRARVMAEVGALSLLAHVSKDRAVKAAATDDAAPQPVAKTLAALMKDIGAAA